MGAVLLVIIAVGKAALVVEYFMHVGKLFSDYSRRTLMSASVAN